ncbi:2,4-dienoyl-CoA reductase, partial [Klebsiella pneumoniae]
VVNATGLTPLLLFVGGLWGGVGVGGGGVFFITGMIDNLAKFTDIKGKRIAVTNADTISLDVIEYFTARGAQAMLIEMQDAAGRDLDTTTKN